jgi:hypothetical protein
MTTRSPLRWMTVSCLLVLLVISGCNSNTGPSSAGGGAAGTYSLTAISGTAPPLVTIPNGAGGCVGTVDRGTFTLDSNNRYTLQLFAHFTCPSPPVNNLTTSEQGTWSASGNNLTFTGPNVLSPASATLDGRTLSVSMNVTSYGSPSENNGQRVPTTWQK